MATSASRAPIGFLFLDCFFLRAGSTVERPRSCAEFHPVGEIHRLGCQRKNQGHSHLPETAVFTGMAGRTRIPDVTIFFRIQRNYVKRGVFLKGKQSLRRWRAWKRFAGAGHSVFRWPSAESASTVGNPDARSAWSDVVAFGASFVLPPGFSRASSQRPGFIMATPRWLVLFRRFRIRFGRRFIACSNNTQMSATCAIGKFLDWALQNLSSSCLEREFCW